MVLCVLRHTRILYVWSASFWSTYGVVLSSNLGSFRLIISLYSLVYIGSDQFPAIMGPFQSLSAGPLAVSLEGPTHRLVAKPAFPPDQLPRAILKGSMISQHREDHHVLSKRCPKLRLLTDLAVLTDIWRRIRNVHHARFAITIETSTIFLESGITRRVHPPHFS